MSFLTVLLCVHDILLILDCVHQVTWHFVKDHVLVCTWHFVDIVKVKLRYCNDFNVMDIVKDLWYLDSILCICVNLQCEKYDYVEYDWL